MAPGDPEKYQASVAGDDHAKLLYRSLEKYDEDQKKKKRPSVILAALVCLFLSSAGGIALAIVLIIHPIEIEIECLSRDLILFAACMTMLYLGLHIRGARKDYIRNGPAPPQNYGNYLHASALLISRLSIAVWIVALVATAVVIAKALPFDGFAGKVPFLELLICIGAIPSFVIISITIEKHTTPFATTAISRTSFLTCRVSEFEEDFGDELSVSRRASIHRKQSQTGSGSILTLPTEDIFRLGLVHPDELKVEDIKGPAVAVNPKIDERTELMASSPIRASRHIPVVPMISGARLHSPPEPTYNPGGWRNEWEDSAEEVGGAPLHPQDSSSDDSAPRYSSRYSPPRSAGAPLRSANNSSKTSSSSSRRAGLGRRSRVSASTSITSSSQRSNLSTVRYAAEPEVAICQPIKVVRNPAYSPAAAVADAGGAAGEAQPPEAAQRRAHPAGARPLRRNPSNFSRPMPPSRLRDSGVDMRMSDAFADDAKK